MAAIARAWREGLRDCSIFIGDNRAKAIRKLDTMALNAVYPDARDWPFFNFRSRSEGGSLLEAYTEICRCRLELKRRRSFGRPDPDLWDEPAYSVNARYNKQNNFGNVTRSDPSSFSCSSC